MNREELLSAACAVDARAAIEEKANCAAVQLPVEALISVMTKIRNEPTLSFDLLLSHTAVHWPAAGQFELLYRLYSTERRHHLLVTSRIPVDHPVAPTLCALWAIAEWQERETYDLFGILYSGHPDLRRLFLEDDWNGYPLRKDYKDDFMLGS